MFHGRLGYRLNPYLNLLSPLNRLRHDYKNFLVLKFNLKLSKLTKSMNFLLENNFATRGQTVENYECYKG